MNFFDLTPDFKFETVGSSGKGYFGITNSTDGDILTVDGSGRFGIGTTSASAKLSITQSVDDNTGGIYLEATDDGHRAVYMDTAQVLNFEGGSGNTATLNAAGVWTDASDIAYKENVFELSYGLSDLMELNPRGYTMKGSGNPQIGFIAQEIELTLPEVVSGEEGKKGVAYGHIVPVVVKAIQEQTEVLFGKEEEGGNRTLFERFAMRVKEAIASLNELVVPAFRAEYVRSDVIEADRLCLDDVCITKVELEALLEEPRVSSRAPAPRRQPESASKPESAVLEEELSSPATTSPGDR